MRDALPKIIIIGLLIAIVGVPILLRPASVDTGQTENLPKLVIYTPHNEQIRYEIQTAYNNWRVATGQSQIIFDWRTPGGTSDIRKGILSQYQSILKDGGSLDSGIGVDLFFGGGDYDHGKIASGISDADDNSHRIVDDPQIDARVMAAAFPADMIGGEPLYKRSTFKEDGQDVEVLAWTGVTLSSFGIVYNNDSLAQLGIDKPKTWSDLADPRLRGWVALADPGHSGSISATFNAILRREGWEQGWATLRMVYANARYFATSSDRVPVDVSRGDAAAGMCIDFYGRYQAGAVGKDRVGYADPVEDGRSMTATNADPITLLRGAPSSELARGFIAWLLSPDAQGLWQRAIDPSDPQQVRPERYELRRQPIRQDVYNPVEKARWVDRELDPYVTAAPFPEGTPSYFSMVAPVTKAMAIDIHHDLSQAWRVLAEARRTGHPELAEMEKRFFAMPEELTIRWPDDELKRNWHAIQMDPDHPRFDAVVATLDGFKAQLKEIGDLDAKRLAWRSFFKQNYLEVIRLGSSSQAAR